MDIDQFKSVVNKSRGFARSNQFLVSLPSLGQYDTRDLNILCAQATLPGRQIMTMERLIGIKGRKMPNGFAQDDVSLSFYVMNDYMVKRYFEEWQNRVVNQDTYEIGYPEDYAADVRIGQLQKGVAFDFPVDKIFGFNVDIDLRSRQSLIYEVKLKDAFPTTMNQIDLSNELDGLVQLNVQLSYRNWEPTLENRRENFGETRSVRPRSRPIT